jgi:hypothetical protein
MVRSESSKVRWISVRRLHARYLSLDSERIPVDGIEQLKPDRSRTGAGIECAAARASRARLPRPLR